MANKKLKLLYLAQYLWEQTDEQHPGTMQEIIAYLASCGISAERKSLYDDLELLRQVLSILTMFAFALGTSIPMVPLPGIGAMIRMPRAARLKAISSSRFLILEIRTPSAGWIS